MAVFPPGRLTVSSLHVYTPRAKNRAFLHEEGCAAVVRTGRGGRTLGTHHLAASYPKAINYPIHVEEQQEVIAELKYAVHWKVYHCSSVPFWHKYRMH